MSDLPELRVSDADRDRTALMLREHAVAGRLTLEEFAERTEKALAARTSSELDELSRDLPAAAPERKPTRFTGVVFGNVERKGRWRVARSSLALVVFGNADIDLRRAELTGGPATLTAFVLFGNVDVYVPEGTVVDIGGLSVFGHRGEAGAETALAGAPLMRLRIFTLFGTADVWRVPAELARAGFREVIRALRRGR
ncbi:MAG: DUF1707 domain-containing protein [Gaiellaceae bacterium]